MLFGEAPGSLRTSRSRRSEPGKEFFIEQFREKNGTRPGYYGGICWTDGYRYPTRSSILFSRGSPIIYIAQSAPCTLMMDEYRNWGHDYGR